MMLLWDDMHSGYLPNWKKLDELSSLLDLPHPPKELYYKGEWRPELFTRCVAVVGSRRMTTYGRQVVEKIIPQLVMENKTVVSGFMYGVDQYAHEQTIAAGGKTIAVLGWGINRKLEGADATLARHIIDSGGLILSEWKNQAATLWTFPVRNRIVAALSGEVIVVEAGLKSGSLITANLANKLKRLVWAVPGTITSSQSAGTNALIADGLAIMWRGKPIQLALKTDDPIINALDCEPMTASELARKLRKPVADIGAKLSLLTVTGQLTERGGTYYACQN